VWLIFLIVFFLLVGVSNPSLRAQTAPSSGLWHLTRPLLSANIAPSPTLLSSYWPANIAQWSNQIYKVSFVYGVDPDLVAAIVQAESRGQADVESYVGAVGLMGVMPYGPGLEWRPTAGQLKDPETNLRWGVSILADILRQSGGDVFSALAAYNGGWRQAHQSYTRDYAAGVLNDYAQAVVVRSGFPPDTAVAWTIAIEKNRGHVPQERYLVLGDQPAAPNRLIGEHVVYQSIDRHGTAYYVKGYAVPLKVPPADRVSAAEKLLTVNSDRTDGDTAVDKSRSRAPRVLLACLPSLERLRGQVSSRWFAPSTCPAQTRD
jgi:hypothetical protein